MPLTFTKLPPSAAFAGSPVIVKCHSDIVDADKVLFPRVVLHLDAIYDEQPIFHGERIYNLSSDGIATFNISPLLVDAIKNNESYGVNSDGVYHNVVRPQYTISLHEIWISDGEELMSEPITADGFTAIPGSLTDAERQRLPESAAEAIGEGGRPLSRKPSVGEVALIGQPYIIPAARVDVSSQYQFQLLAPDSTSLDTKRGSGLLEFFLSTWRTKRGVYTISGPNTNRKVFFTLANRDTRQFIFVNGFGMLESITAVCPESKVSNITSETYSVIPELSFTSMRSLISDTHEDDTEYSMSSGPVTPEWAEWWQHEFLTTSRAWLYDNGTWLPCAIIPEKTTTLYSRFKPTAQSIPFTVRLAHRASTTLLWPEN